MKTEGVAPGRFAVEVKVLNNHDVHLASHGALPPEKVRFAVLSWDRRFRRCEACPSGEHGRACLGVHAMGEATVRYADQRTATRPVVEEVRLELLGRHGTFSAIVEPERTTALIGAIVLEDLDLLVDCTRQQLTPRDPDRIVSGARGMGGR